MFLAAVRTPQDGIANEPMNPRQVSHNAGRNFPVCFGALDDDHRDHGALPQCGTVPSQVLQHYFLAMKLSVPCSTANKNLTAISMSANADSNGAVQVAECGERS